ncbi:MAG: hypothetical protein ACLGJB_10730 [Blastocatellia bacterium]
MAQVFDPYKSLWWRFSDYELQDGYISPSPVAEPELYDPWQAYRDSWDNDPDSATPWAEKRLQGPPYLSLLALAEGLEIDSDGVKLGKKNTDRLLKWCSEFGLLGILHQRVHMVALAPRWLPENPWKAAVEGKLPRPKGGLLYPTQFIYYRDNSLLLKMEGTKVQGWNPGVYRLIEEGQKGKRVGQIYDGLLSVQPGVLIQEMILTPDSDLPRVKVKDTLFQETFQGTWSNFFPSIPKRQVETYLYPPPVSPPFWEIYSERLWDFFMGVLALRDALICLNESEDRSDERGITHRSRGFRLLNNLVSSSSMVLATDRNGSFRQEWRAASLLGCFAMMALQDLTQQRKVIRCEKCNRLFVTEAYQARYCSDRCRHTAQKRRYRQRLKEEKDNG